MKIVAFGASTSRASINQQFAEYTAQLFPNAQVEILHLIDYECPLYSPEREALGIPETIPLFMQKLLDSDLIVLSLAEHNGSYTAAFKNLFDWCSRYRQNTFENLRFFLLSTSPGPRAGMGVMQAALDRFPRHNAEILDHFSLPSFGANFQTGQGITDGVFNNTLLDKIEQIRKII
ncbi:MAG: NAD(P)H-dependent oxidoreductase [Bacteroidetes bacterium]|nr:NAD(P)H-dependent oxidoreductase [Bacteroidota bacterium]MBM3424506.1 NAD(P)H-dependent oxidoreductase [Bacteroidota bacterium]